MENDYESTKIKSNELVGTESAFTEGRIKKNKKLFDYEAGDEVIENKERHFKITYFLSYCTRLLNHWINVVLNNWNRFQIILIFY